MQFLGGFSDGFGTKEGAVLQAVDFRCGAYVEGLLLCQYFVFVGPEQKLIEKPMYKFYSSFTCVSSAGIAGNRLICLQLSKFSERTNNHVSGCFWSLVVMFLF
jgi:hypothetical protein